MSHSSYSVDTLIPNRHFQLETYWTTYTNADSH